MDFEEEFRMKVKETINIKELNVKVGVIGIMQFLLTQKLKGRWKE